MDDSLILKLHERLKTLFSMNVSLKIGISPLIQEVLGEAYRDGIYGTVFKIMNARLIMIDKDLIIQHYKKGFMPAVIQREVGWWGMYPLSLEAVFACVIVHELTHHQLFDEKDSKCNQCINSCKHCPRFYKQMWRNWEVVVEEDFFRWKPQ